jgi:hypothetical protein
MVLKRGSRWLPRFTHQNLARVVRDAVPQLAGQFSGQFPGERVRSMNTGSSDARYASIAASVALCLRSSMTTLSYVSRLVCQV